MDWVVQIPACPKISQKRLKDESDENDFPRIAIVVTLAALLTGVNELYIFPAQKADWNQELVPRKS